MTHKLSTCASRVLDINPFFNQDANTIQTSNHHGEDSYGDGKGIPSQWAAFHG